MHATDTHHPKKTDQSTGIDPEKAAATGEPTGQPARKRSTDERSAGKGSRPPEPTSPGDEGGAPAAASPDTPVKDRAEGGHRPPSEGSHQEKEQRKQKVLTHGSASVVRSISDAIVIKDGEPFFLCPPNGQVGLDGRHGFGLYHHDTRFLSGYELKLGSQTPNPLAATAALGTRAILELTNTELDTPDGPIGKERLGIHWVRSIEGNAPLLRDEITIRNLGQAAVHFPVSVALSCDFRDVFAIRGLLDERPGTLHDPAWHDGKLRFAYSGKDRVERSVTVSFDPAPASTSKDGATFDVRIEGHSDAKLSITLDIGEQVQKGAPPIERRGSASENRPERSSGFAAAEPDTWVGGGEWEASVQSDSLLLDEVLGRSLDDLGLLRGRLGGSAYYEAGIPWFATLFGRDSLISALQTLAFGGGVAGDTLQLLARRQGTKDDEWRDEQPGKILHELRIGELARLGEIPHTPYYGTIDATPLFLILLARHAQWTGSLELFHSLRKNVEAALDWIDRTEEHFGGYLAYESTTERGLVNQGWKDSGDAIVTADGSLATPPIALVEVQGYVFMARREIAELYDRAGDGDRGDRLRKQAEELRQRFEKDFWSERLGCYVLALGKDRAPCEVISSNAGQAVWTGIASPDRAARVAKRLLADDVFGGWGIRTLATSERAYTPIGYHLGTIWPHDNGIIAAGFRRYGLADDAERVLVGLVEAAADFEHRRLPECFAGYSRQEYGVPVRYPVACHPQAWAAGSIPHVLTATLGLVPEAFDKRLRVVEPRLPPFVSHLEMKDIRVGKGTAHLRFERLADGSTKVDVVGTERELDVRVEQAHRPGGRRHANEAPEGGMSTDGQSTAGKKPGGKKPGEEQPGGGHDGQPHGIAAGTGGGAKTGGPQVGR